MGMFRQYPHYAQALDRITGKMVYPRLVPTPMRPLDVAQEHPLDYTTPQTIMFYNKGIDKLNGDAFLWILTVYMADQGTRQSLDDGMVRYINH
jgi:hypothetical protein